MNKKLGIIDLGSNSVRMIIMKVYEDKTYKLVEQAKGMVRLSEKMGEEKTLKPAPIQRTVYTLKLFKKLAEAHKVDEIFCIATGAVRHANNQRAFLERVKRETGFDFDVISGKQEGYYDYLGVINTIDIKDCIIMDVGGASTELVWVENRELKGVISLPYGAVILTEKFLGKAKNHLEQIQLLEKFIYEQLEHIKWLKRVIGLPLVGIGGTIRTLAKINKRKIRFPLESLHNYQMTYEEVVDAYKLVTKAKEKDRKKIPGVQKERADIIAGGLVPVKILMDYLKINKLIVSGNGLREGVFFKNYLKACKFQDDKVRDVLYHRVENIIKKYDINMKHSYQVQKLALSLFDQTKHMHGFGEDERKLLSVSSLLHDIGIYVDYYNHHKHGFYLVLNSRIYGLGNKELLMCAFLVAMHRNTAFKGNWKKYNMLINKEDYEKIKKLSLFLRIAEMLDRSEYGSVKGLMCNLTKDDLRIILKVNNTVDLEIAAAMKSEKEFEKLFHRKLSIEQKNHME